MSYKTPGVYVQEKSLYPPSVAGADTAVPALIGYTEKALDAGGDDLRGIPVKIRSLVEFESLYGKAFEPAAYHLVTDENKGNAIVSVKADKRFFLYDAMRQLFDNGGGICFVVSVGNYNDKVDLTALSKGIDALRKYDEPTLLLVPDAVGLLDENDEPDGVGFSKLQKLALTQCAGLQNRFCILDLMLGYLPETITDQPIADFRNRIGINHLQYGAAYYPWLVSNYSHPVHLRKLHFYEQADPDTPIDDPEDFSKDPDENLPVTAWKQAVKQTDAATGGGGSAISAERIRQEGAGHLRTLMAGYQGNLQENIAHKNNTSGYMAALAFMVKAMDATDRETPAGSDLKRDISAMHSDQELTAAISHLVGIEKNEDSIANNLNSRVADINDVDAIYQSVDEQWFGGVAYGDIPVDGTSFTTGFEGSLQIIEALKESADHILKAYGSLVDAVLHYEREAEKTLFSAHAFFRGVFDKVTVYMQTIPPSGAIAGIYARVDHTHGVWKAPANVSLVSVKGPAVKIDSRDQETLNIHPTGKSINAIRNFTGKGTLVWGARTLAGNDNEWKYIPVRRFFIMIEQRLKKAVEAFTFDANDAGTWVKVRAMAENFLTIQWRSGALQGAKPEDAFFVRVGEGETMTGQDVLEGRMIVEVGLAAVRPAEFIILRFSHKMQT